MAYTPVTSDLYYNNGSLGTLKIPAIGLTVRVYEGTDSTALKKGAGHFSDTSIWNGNVCIAGHNRGINNHFGQIHTLGTGDTITYTTKLGTRSYCRAVAGLPAGSFVNVADVGGTYNGTWVQAVSRWVTSVYGKPTVPKLPRTGY